MTQQETQKKEAYENIAAVIFDTMDELHVAMVNLRVVSGEIADMGQESELAIMAAVAIPLPHVADCHGHLSEMRESLINPLASLSGKNSVAVLTAAGITLADWDTEWNNPEVEIVRA